MCKILYSAELAQLYYTIFPMKWWKKGHYFVTKVGTTVWTLLCFVILEYTKSYRP